MDTTKLSQIANEILEANPEGILSGSLALHKQGFKIRREPQDIDIFMPYGSKFIPIEGMVKYNGGNDGGYDDEDYERVTYKWTEKAQDVPAFLLDETLIDILTSVNEDFPTLKISEKGNYVSFEEILKFKIAHSFGERLTGQLKHKHDIIHMLINNY